VLKLSQRRIRPLPSLLLYGPPGTGKTELARRIAKSENYYFIALSGSSIAQFEEAKALETLNRLFQYADRTSLFDKRKVVIFIDEAEEFLGKRDQHRSEKAQKLLTQFLSYTGSRSPNYTIFYATNRPNVLDEAMNRRITYHMEVGLPGPVERAQILAKYCSPMKKDKLLTIQSPVFTNVFYKKIAENTKGLSGADLEDICAQTENEGYLNGNSIDNVLVETVVEKVKNKHTQKNDYVNQKI
jgi:SpoVK/Ycf46/Vps4 family AAA+-type ATPase